MLGIIHRTVLHKGPTHLFEYIKVDRNARIKRHRNHLIDLSPAARTSAVKRSMPGLIAIYNLLPSGVAEQKTIGGFQRGLQQMVKDACAEGLDQWTNLLSPRLALAGHPLH